MKQCRKCGETKALDEFCATQRNSDGRTSRCKACHNAAMKVYRQANPELRERQRKHNRAHYKLYPERQLERNRMERLEHPERIRARKRVEKALIRGLLTKASACSACGTEGERVEAHHEDYERPLDVTWLCGVCHSKADRAREEVAE